MLGTEPGSSESALNCCAISLPFIIAIVTVMVLGMCSVIHNQDVSTLDQLLPTFALYGYVLKLCSVQGKIEIW